MSIKVNGFEILEPTEEFEKFIEQMLKPPKDKKEKKPNKKKNKYKKGSLKYELFKLINKIIVSQWVERFHMIKLENIILCRDGDKVKTFIRNRRVSKAKLQSLIKKYPDISVLINIGFDQYQKLPLDTYLKLCKIQRIAINTKFYVTADGTYDRELITESNQVVDSINNLLYTLIHERTRVEVVTDYQCNICWYDIMEMEYKLMILFEDGSTKYYRNINDFCKEYKLTLF